MSSEKIIIMFKEGVSKEQIDKYISEINGGGGEVVHNYGDLLPGFAAHVTPSQLQLFQSLQDDVIASIERDSVVTTQ